ncbi:inosine-uridine preferring nucleoside hydrolase [Liquorilactobacillus sucicola DSM 21376 = JCM 15457]|uniref:Ribosylpyrimidine nucleosidase n=1 Tax=Liquorilactobacillus sucicola DSM 21376 = JCM 15457 TaxID=1423806 RepID=A0A023CVB5_9LACO|nr:ribonucleoside hydrolase RihC [Liquorilactobacillus sucicola]KRN05463.1 ribosylpyrimidine nucleosidase [Liquorilactobacillus sucicola DSM 21376 = JCM 15457]GAJ25541.1 inosine-uridine preferring nucleoside hydrolase [Liquorilactobacillus sucicola DSM 21376 = JCM 15457]
MARSVILDMDPGIDDAAAIAVALNNPGLDVKLITTVAGNVSVDKTTVNALKLVNFFNKNVPVARGAAAPLKKRFEDAGAIHGESGLPGYDFPEPKSQISKLTAIDAIAHALTQSEKQLTLIATGAYTNIAQFILQYPELLSKIDELILMGGSISGGNATSVAEFNVFTDPDAAKIVFESGLNITMIGLDVTLKALISKQTSDRLAEFGEAGRMLHGIINAYGDVHEGGKPMHDVITVLYALHPEVIKLQKEHIDAVTDGPAIGATVADVLHRWYEKNDYNAEVGVDIDAAFFNDWFLKQVSRMSNR